MEKTPEEQTIKVQLDCYPLQAIHQTQNILGSDTFLLVRIHDNIAEVHVRLSDAMKVEKIWDVLNEETIRVNLEEKFQKIRDAIVEQALSVR